MMGRGFLVTLATVLATSLSAVSASAEPVSEVIPRLIEEGGWLKAHYPGQPVDKEHPSLFDRHEPSMTPSAFLGSTLHIAIVARDWREAYSLTDGRALLFDRVRLIRSSRMAVTRVSLSGGRLLPYAEMSFGQWRADVDLVPWLKNDMEAAGQIALGFEMHLARRCKFAWDVEETQIYVDQEKNVPATRLVASFAALRAEF
jgi:hypothetical protein